MTIVYDRVPQPLGPNSDRNVNVPQNINIVRETITSLHGAPKIMREPSSFHPTILHSLASGTRSTVFHTKSSREVVKALYESLENRIVVTHPASIPDGVDLVVKVMGVDKDAWEHVQSSNEAWVEAVTDMVLDAGMHARIMRQPPIYIRDGVVVSPHDVAPRMFFSGVTRDGGLYVIVMERARGIELVKTPITSMVVAMVEKAVLSLIAFGVDHGDSHTSNILIDMGKRKATFIDFGFSVPLPTRLRTEAITAIRAALSSLRRTGRWDDTAIDRIFIGPRKVLDISNARMHRRGYFEYYNSAYHLLQALKKKVDEGHLNNSRALVWGGKPLKKRQRMNSNRTENRVEEWRKKSRNIATRP